MTDNQHTAPITSNASDSKESKANPRCISAVRELNDVIDDAVEVWAENAEAVDPQELLYHKGCICVSARTAYAALLDHLIWLTDEVELPDRELLRVGRGSFEHQTTLDALKRAEKTIEQTRPERDDEYLGSVRAKVNDFEDEQ